jgi:hypothetical protein
MTPDQSDQIDRILRDSSDHGIDWCLLCGANRRDIGVFFPTLSFSKRLGMPEGTIILYGLCGGCSDLADRIARVETRMLQDLTIQ